MATTEALTAAAEMQEPVARRYLWMHFTAWGLDKVEVPIIARGGLARLGLDGNRYRTPWRSSASTPATGAGDRMRGAQVQLDFSSSGATRTRARSSCRRIAGWRPVT
jgi:hypothetical protein